MPSSIRLVCTDSSVQAAIRNWLDRNELAPQIELALHVSVREPQRPKDGRAVFKQSTVEIQSGPPQGDVFIKWTLAPATAVLSVDSNEAHVTLSPAAASNLDQCIPTFLTTVLVFLLRRAGWHHVHGATAKDQQGRGWLIAGNARAGKSTTAALLASRGWPVGTDDTAFLVDEGEHVSVKAYHSPIALREGGYALLNRQAGQYQERRRKMACWPEELGGSWLPSIEPDILLFPTVGDSVSQAEPIGTREALAELVRWSAWVVLEPELAQEHLDLLARLAKQAKSYRVLLGRDLFENPNRLTELIP
jgi:hypothetical protein